MFDIWAKYFSSKKPVSSDVEAALSAEGICTRVAPPIDASATVAGCHTALSALKKRARSEPHHPAIDEALTILSTFKSSLDTLSVIGADLAVLSDKVTAEQALFKTSKTTYMRHRRAEFDALEDAASLLAQRAAPVAQDIRLLATQLKAPWRSLAADLENGPRGARASPRARKVLAAVQKAQLEHVLRVGDISDRENARHVIEQVVAERLRRVVGDEGSGSEDAGAGEDVAPLDADYCALDDMFAGVYGALDVAYSVMEFRDTLHDRFRGSDNPLLVTLVIGGIAVVCAAVSYQHIKTHGTY